MFCWTLLSALIKSGSARSSFCVSVIDSIVWNCPSQCSSMYDASTFWFLLPCGVYAPEKLNPTLNVRVDPMFLMPRPNVAASPRVTCLLVNGMLTSWLPCRSALSICSSVCRSNSALSVSAFPYQFQSMLIARMKSSMLMMSMTTMLMLNVMPLLFMVRG